jgi:hypothetical protein
VNPLSTANTVLRAPPINTLVMPGDFIELTVPNDAQPDCQYALEPKYDSAVNRGRKLGWPLHQEVIAVGNNVRVTNFTHELVKKNTTTFVKFTL